jgi:hypothetical protein
MTQAMKTRTLIIAAAVIAVLAGAYAWTEYDRGLADAGAMAVAERVTAAELLAAFRADETAATARFVGTTEQAMEVTGPVRAIEPQGAGPVNVLLDTGDDMAAVLCEFAPGTVPDQWAPGTSVTVAGICTGMLMDVVLVRCVPVE